MSKTIIIGGSFAGLSCAVEAKGLYPEMEVLVFDKETTSGFIPSGVNLALNQEVKQLSDATFLTEKAVRGAGVQLHLEQEVMAIDFAAKWVQVRHTKTEEVKQYAYDQLVLAMGSLQTGHLTAHLRDKQIVSTKTLRSAEEALAVLEEAQQIVVIGGGQIGIEASEALVNANKYVTLIEANPTVAYRYFDEEFVADIQQAIEFTGVDLRVNTKVEAVETEPLKVVTEDDELYPEAVIMGTNLVPNTLLVAEDLRLNADKTIWTTPYLETSVTDVFAIGDLVQAPYMAEEQRFIALVNNAIRSGQVAAFNLLQRRIEQPVSLRVIGSRVFSQYITSIGQTEHEARQNGDCLAVTVEAAYSLTDATPVYLKLVVEQESGRILGAQMRSEQNILHFADTLALAVQQRLTDAQLAFQDRLYYPRETSADPIIYRAALMSFSQRLSK